MMSDAVPVPPAVAEQARAALAERTRNAGIPGASRQAVMCALELAQAPYVPEDTLALVGAWHAANPRATTADGRCTRLAGMYGGAPGRKWALDQAAMPAVSWLAEESATLEAMTAAPDHQGGMIALYPDDAEQLTVTGGEPADELHVTLAFVAEDAATLHPDAVAAIESAAENGAGLRSAPLLLTVVGAGTLGDSEPPATVLFLQQEGHGGYQDGVAAVARAVRAELDDYGSEGFPVEHDAFIPHMTIAYSDLYGAPRNASAGPARLRGTPAGGVCRHGWTDGHAMPDLAENASKTAAIGVPTVNTSSSAGVTGGDGGVPGSSDRAGRGRASSVPDQAVPNSGPSRGGQGTEPRESSRQGTDAGSVLGPQDPLRAPQQPRVGSVLGVHEGSDGALAGTQPGQGRGLQPIGSRQGDAPPSGASVRADGEGAGCPSCLAEAKAAAAAGLTPERLRAHVKSLIGKQIKFSEGPTVRLGDVRQAHPWKGGKTAAVVGAAAVDSLAVLGERAQRARRRLEERTMAAAQVAMRDALRRAGVKIIQKSARRSTAAKAAVKAADGKWTPAVLAAAGITEQDLIRQAFDSLGERYEQWVLQAATDQLRAVAATLGLPPEEVLSRMSLRMGDVASAARTRLNEDLTKWAYRLLAEPVPSFGDVGEVPVDPTMPRSILQPSLSLADGRNIGAPNGEGLLIEAWLTFDPNAPVEVVTWECGSPARPFPPHQELCGTSTQWADYDSVFAADVGSFPRGESIWFPGDHTGCLCSSSYTYIARPTL